MVATVKQDKPKVSSEKARYKARNWSEYDRALVRRGSLTIWFDDEFLRQHWKPAPSGKRGAPMQYTDAAIQCLLTMKQVFHLPYRALEGLARSLMQLMSVDLPVPDHTHMSRRAATLEVVIVRRQREGAIHLVADSTGLKVYGEGEWKVRQHGVGKRRTWRKVHLGMDENAKDVIAVEVTTANWGDPEVFPDLLAQVDTPIAQVSVDGAYDTKDCHAAIRRRGAKATIPPRKGAKPWGGEHPRDAVLREIADKGEAEWTRSSGYHRRSLAENAMYRLKQLFGDRLSSREFGRQANEIHCRIAAMNVMTYLGMPDSVCCGRGVSTAGAMV